MMVIMTVMIFIKTIIIVLPLHTKINSQQQQQKDNDTFHLLQAHEFA
jgi:uncharacterized membrane protein